MAGHWLTDSQWALPTAENYAWLRNLVNAGKPSEFLRKDYEDLRKDYEDLRRYFDMHTGDQKTDVWRFNPETERLGHPTQKPLELIERCLLASTNPGDFVLDPFLGSGTTGVAASRHGRRFTGIEMNPAYLDTARKRVLDEINETGLRFSKP
jgi:site-specific DNA-methyltransferase (adenine-specific)